MSAPLHICGCGQEKCALGSCLAPKAEDSSTDLQPSPKIILPLGWIKQAVWHGHVYPHKLLFFLSYLPTSLVLPLSQVFHLYYSSKRSTIKRKRLKLKYMGVNLEWVLQDQTDALFLYLTLYVIWQVIERKAIKESETFCSFMLLCWRKVFFPDLCFCEYITSILDCNPNAQRNN